MFWLWVFSQLARMLTLMVCWTLVMGVPILLFEEPLDAAQLRLFPGVFYPTLAITGIWLSRSWGGKGLVLMTMPFWLLFSAQAVAFALVPDYRAAAAYLFIFPVTWVCWRIGLALPSAARDHGMLLGPDISGSRTLDADLKAFLAAQELPVVVQPAIEIEKPTKE